jgi:(S)-2-hydroxy-acid oxidase
VDLSTTVLGEKIKFPICLAPAAMQQMACHEGEKASARAAERMETLMVLSSWSTVSLEDVVSAAPKGLKWFQLYVYKV